MTWTSFEHSQQDRMTSPGVAVAWHDQPCRMLTINPAKSVSPGPILYMYKMLLKLLTDACSDSSVLSWCFKFFYERNYVFNNLWNNFNFAIGFSNVNKCIYLTFSEAFFSNCVNSVYLVACRTLLSVKSLREVCAISLFTYLQYLLAYLHYNQIK